MIQLRIKTEYSFGATFAPINRLIECLKENGCTAAGMIDIGSTWGHVKWFNACKAAGIKPLLGIEITVSDDDTYAPKMWFLAKNQKGLSELYKAVSRAHLNSIKTRAGSLPRMYFSDVLSMSENIIKFAGDVLDAEFLKGVGAYVDLNPSSKIQNAKKIRIASEYGLKLVSTSDNAYAYENDAETFELMSKVGLKTSKQHLLWNLEHQDVAREIADTIDIEPPTAPMVRVDGDLEALCRRGIVERGMLETWTQEYEERLLYELDLIKSKDFESYFIIVADMTMYAKKHMLVGPSRGSAAGSLVCYLARITEIDPIPPKLYFERFIDVSRSDLPDIDLDFPDNKRHMVFEYMSGKYGINNVAHIGTVSVYKPKSALIQVCKALNIPAAATAGVKVAMIERSIADARASNCLQDTFETTEAGKAFAAAYPLALAAAYLEGHASHSGVHAAGLLVCNEEITNFCVVDADGIAHIDKYSAETLGLLKIDVLGLRTLSILEDANVGVDWYGLKFNDQKTLDIFNEGRLCGIFQFEGSALRVIAEKVNFKSIVEIDAVTALARPGPFAAGVANKYVDRMRGEAYEPIHPVVEQYMIETFGLPVYQEQTFAIVKNIGGFNWEDTTFIRKAISKRMGKEFFDSFYPKFEAGAARLGVSSEKARETWEMINTMGSWQMNKAHTYSYAAISYWTAYLKAHHPLEFAAANLRNAKDEDSAVLLLREMVNEGVEYIPFDINLSEKNWCVKDGKLVGGFISLKGIGESKAEKLIKARNAGELTDKQIETIKSVENIFNDIFPIKTKYGRLYENPRENNILGELSYICDIPDGLPHGDERIVIGELIHKSIRNANEDVNIKKRGGKKEVGQLEYLDFRIRDDTGVIGGRIGRKDYLRIGIGFAQNVPLGAHLLMRAKFWNGMRYLFVTKWKRLDTNE